MHNEPNEIEMNAISNIKEDFYKAREKIEKVFCKTYKDCENCPIKTQHSTKHCPYEHANFGYSVLLDVLYKQARCEIARNEKNEEEKK